MNNIISQLEDAGEFVLASELKEIEIHAKMSSEQRKKISKSLKKHWRKAKEKTKKVKESKFAELLKKGATNIDPMYLLSLLGADAGLKNILKVNGGMVMKKEKGKEIFKRLYKVDKILAEKFLDASNHKAYASNRKLIKSTEQDINKLSESLEEDMNVIIEAIGDDGGLEETFGDAEVSLHDLVAMVVREGDAKQKRAIKGIKSDFYKADKFIANAKSLIKSCSKSVREMV